MAMMTTAKTTTTTISCSSSSETNPNPRSSRFTNTNNLHRLSNTITLLLLLISTTTLLSIQQSDALATTPPPSSPQNSQSKQRPSNKKTSNNNNNDSSSRSNHPSQAGSKRAADRNKKWYSNRSAGIKTKHNRKRPPRWEVEGDALFLLVEDAIIGSVVEDDGEAGAGGLGEGEEMVDGSKTKTKGKKKKKKGTTKTKTTTTTTVLSTREEYESAVQILKSAFGIHKLPNSPSSNPSSSSESSIIAATTTKTNEELQNQILKAAFGTTTTTTTTSTTTTRGIERNPPNPDPTTTSTTTTTRESSSSSIDANNEQPIVTNKTKEELQKLTIKQLKEMITIMNLPPDVNQTTSQLRLKADIINFVLQHQPQQPNKRHPGEDAKSSPTTNKTQITKLPPPPPTSKPNPLPPSKPWMWGKCSTGPVLKSQLLSSQFHSPTPVQEAAFATITTRNTNSGIRPNVVIASPTGTGKTLAYLLPILSVTERRSGGKTGSKVGGGGGGVGSSVLIVTPTVELAVQIQAVVDKLWPPPSSSSSSALYVIGVKDDPATTLQSIQDLKPPILAGTPKSLNGLISHCRKDPATWAGSDGLCSNLKIVVLDEADRLLQTERMARLMQQQQNKATNNDNHKNNNSNNNNINNKPSATHELLTTLTRHHNLSLDNSSPAHATTLQLICASATVGRTLRRQIMDLTNAASMDKAATLVCGEGDGRVGKMEDVRRRSVGPSCLTHCYRVWDGSGDGETKENGEDDRMHAIWETLRGLPPAPCLIFPGKHGVAKVCEFLSSSSEDGGCGLRNVRTLRGLYTPNNNDDDDGITTTAMEELISTSSSSSPSSSWSTAPVYVVEERFARGLDIPNLHYVFLSTPPTSGALYTHLAGRTGRAGQDGAAITLVGPSVGEAKRLVGLGQTLGIGFSSLEDLGFGFE